MPRVHHVLAVLTVAIVCSFSISTNADEQTSAVASVMRLLKSGRVPQSRLSAFVEQIGRRGNEHDLAYLFHQAQQSPEYDEELRLKVYELLIDAARTRNVKPAGDVSSIAALITDRTASPRLRRAAIELAGIWKVPSAAEPLKRIAIDEGAAPAERQSAMKALTSIGGPVARETILTLTEDDHSFEQRSQGVAALVELDMDLAARRAAALLQKWERGQDLSVVIDAFLDREGASQKLAAAIADAEPSKDAAMLALRHMYSVGRSDAELSDVLGRLAGIDANPQPLDKQQVAAIVARVAAEGDAARGEQVFRRADLSCMKCHALSKAGGQVGPDLSALGASSPVDYIVNSISDPDQQIKEAFTTQVVITVDGLVHQGIVVDRTNDRLVLKDAKGQQVTIPTADIEEEVEGKSLMPKGLMKFMTDTEFVDLVKFLSMLGRPGTPYAIRQTPRMQRWRVLTDVPEALRSPSALEADWEEYLARPPAVAPAYAHVNGELPLAELAEMYGPVLFLIGEVDVSQEGEIGVQLDSAEGVQTTVESFSSTDREFALPLSRGRHEIMLRVDTRTRSQPTLTLELFRVPGSSAEFEVVDGA